MKKALLVKRSDICTDKMLLKALSELGFETETASNFSGAAAKIRDGFNTVITGLILDEETDERYKLCNNGAFVAALAKDAGIPNVALATATPELINDDHRKIIKNIRIIDLSIITRKSLQNTLADFIGKTD